jgi:hypothetical protein
MNKETLRQFKYGGCIISVGAGWIEALRDGKNVLYREGDRITEERMTLEMKEYIREKGFVEVFEEEPMVEVTIVNTNAARKVEEFIWNNPEVKMFEMRYADLRYGKSLDRKKPTVGWVTEKYGWNGEMFYTVKVEQSWAIYHESEITFVKPLKSINDWFKT